MRWWSHKIVAGSSCWALTGEVIPTICCIAGSVFPDGIEILSGGILKHRHWTHWFPLWIGVGVGLLLTPHRWSSWVAFGALLHIATDAMSLSGVPRPLHPHRRKGFGLYRTGTHNELWLAIGLAAVAIGIATFRGFCSLDYLFQAVQASFHWGMSFVQK